MGYFAAKVLYRRLFRRILWGVKTEFREILHITVIFLLALISRILPERFFSNSQSFDANNSFLENNTPNDKIQLKRVYYGG